MGEYSSRERRDGIGNALLTLIYLTGGSHHQLRSSDTYGPLADTLHIGDAERREYYTNGSKALVWPNQVQWVRQDLVDTGFIDGSEHGMWRLTVKGVAFAQILQRITDQVAAIMKHMKANRSLRH
jgi:hypothetical protein